jgi:hypothetical protein
MKTILRLIPLRWSEVAELAKLPDRMIAVTRLDGTTIEILPAELAELITEGETTVRRYGP